ncbi:MAG: hypothetical protein ACJAYU_001919 [Bradymonadia bacterium]|jgi:hypothetical protein
MRMASKYTPDSLLHVRTESGDFATEVACNDDSDLSDTLNSLVFFDDEAGHTYYIFADSYDLEAEGTFTIELSLNGCFGGDRGKSCGSAARVL